MMSLPNALSKHIAQLEGLGLLPEQWVWYHKVIEQMKKVDDQIIDDLIKVYKDDKKEIIMRAHPEVIELKNTLENMVEQPHDVSRSVQAREAQQANRLLQEVYALELDGHLLSLPTHKRGWRNFIRKTSTPIKAAAAGAMILGGAYGANANENQAPPTGIHQTVSGSNGYVTLNPIDTNFVLQGSTTEEYGSNLVSVLKQTYVSFDESDPVNQAFVSSVTRFAKLKKGKVASIYNREIAKVNNFYNLFNYIDTLEVDASFRDTLKKFYSDNYVEGKRTLDLGVEKTRLDSIPSDGILVKVNGTNTLYDMVKTVYPGVDNLSGQQQKKVFDYLVDINPSVFLGASLTKVDGKVPFFREDKTDTNVIVTENGKTMKFVYSFRDKYPTILIPHTNTLATIANK